MTLWVGTYLSHATSEGDSPSVVNDTLGVNSPVHTMVGVLVDEGAELRLNLKLNSLASDLLHIFVVYDIEKQEICNRLCNLLVRLNTGDAGFPWTKEVLWTGLGRGSRWLAVAGLVGSRRFWRSVPALSGTTVVLAIDMGVNLLLQHKIGVVGQFIVLLGASSPDRWL